MSESIQVTKQTVKNICNKISKKITPGKKELKKLKRVEKLLEDRLLHFNLKFKVAGSYARQTQLSKSADIDFFIFYNPLLGKKKIAERGLSDLKRAAKGLNYWVRFAEHPYLEGEVEGVRFNLVPCAETKKGKWITPMDRSKFHNLFLMKNLNDNLRREIRVFKAFLKANKLYGAEIKIGGFSGYVSELLTIKYGSFEKALKNISKWKLGEVVSIEPIDYDPHKKFTTPIIIIDPVDKFRNLSAAIKPSNIAKLIMLSNIFLRNPNVTYFRGRKKTPNAKILSNVLLVSFPINNTVEDIRWGQYYKSAKALICSLNTNGFEPIKYSIGEKGKWTTIALLLKNINNNLELKQGPPVTITHHSLQFLENKKYENIWFDKDMRSYNIEIKKQKSALKFIKQIINEPEKHGLSKGLKNEFKKAKINLYDKQLAHTKFGDSVKEACLNLFEALI